MAHTSPLKHEPRQERSRKSAESILNAVETLLELGRNFEDVSITEITALAGTTTGGFYARFASKHAVLITLYQEVALRELRNAIHDALDPAACEGKDIRYVVHAYLGSMAAVYAKHRAVWRSVGLSMRVDADFKDALDLVIQLNKEIAGVLRARVLERRVQIGHPDPEFALDLANLFCDGTLHYKINLGLSTIPFSHANWVSDEKMVDELTNAFLAYLQVKE